MGKSPADFTGGADLYVCQLGLGAFDAALAAAIGRRLNALVSVLEPALIQVVGSVVAIVVLAILLPIFEITQLIV